MRTYIDCMPYEGGYCKYLVFIRHLDEKSITLATIDEDNELDYLGCDNLGRLPLNTTITVTDEDGEKHEITILSKDNDYGK